MCNTKAHPSMGLKNLEKCLHLAQEMIFFFFFFLMCIMPHPICIILTFNVLSYYHLFLFCSKKKKISFFSTSLFAPSHSILSRSLLPHLCCSQIMECILPNLTQVWVQRKGKMHLSHPRDEFCLFHPIPYI